MFNEELLKINEKIMENPGYRLSDDEALYITNLPDTEILELIHFAGKIKKRFGKNEIYTCTIINAKSGSCPENCAFCAQSAHHSRKGPFHGQNRSCKLFICYKRI
jgi:biotin synthase